MNVGDTVKTRGDLWVKPLDGSMRRLEFRVGEIGKVVAIDPIVVEIALADRMIYLPTKYADKFAEVLTCEEITTSEKTTP